MKILRIFYGFLIFSIFLLGCTKKSLEGPTKPVIIVTIPPYADFVQKIAGNTVDIVTILPPGANLHTYEPAPYDVTKIGFGLIWFMMEEPLEKKILRALKEKNPSLIEVDLQKGIHLLSTSENVSLAPCNDSGHVHHEGKDLHTWMSPKIALQQTETIIEYLVRLIPENADLYKKNYLALSEEMHSLDDMIEEMLAPYEGKAILVSHPSFGYFCYDFHLLQLSVECEGKEPRPKDIEALLQKINTHNVKVVFIQKGFNNKGTELIAKKLHLPIYEVDPYARDYVKTIQTISSLIAQ